MAQESWKDKLAEVRNFTKGEEKTIVEETKEVDVEESADDILNREIEEELNSFDSEEVVEETLEEKRTRLQGELREIEQQIAEQNQPLEKSIEKLTERNMLGRLAKTLRLNEQGKEKLFTYFDKGEL
jgi:predicted metal-dependent hydrolase